MCDSAQERIRRNKIQHFFADPSCVDGEQIRLAGSDVNHMKNVLRMKTGEELTVNPVRKCGSVMEREWITSAVWKVMRRRKQSFVL